MPKKTPRGGRYTTGIKRTPSGGYGGQTYGRRGCMVMGIVLGVLALSPVAAVAFWAAVKLSVAGL